MITARERLLNVSSLSGGNLARDHMLSISSSINSLVLIPEQGNIIESEIPLEILNVDYISNEIETEILELSSDFESELEILDGEKDEHTVQECC